MTAAGEVIGVRDTRRTRVVLVVLLVAALALIALNYSDGSNPALRGLRTRGRLGLRRCRARGELGGRHFFGVSSAPRRRSSSLQQQVVQLRAELSGAELSKADYAELRKMLLVAGAASTGSWRPA